MPVRLWTYDYVVGIHKTGGNVNVVAVHDERRGGWIQDDQYSENTSYFCNYVLSYKLVYLWS